MENTQFIIHFANHYSKNQIDNILKITKLQIFELENI